MQSRLRSIVDLFRNTPFHPQWLMRDNSFEIQVLQEKATGTVLDIGCASRWVTNHIAESCFYIGLDYPVTGIHMYDSRPDVYSDASQLPFGDQAIDTVILFQTLEHLSRPHEAIAEIHRVLRPGGSLLLTVPFLYPLHDEPFDFTRFTSHGLKVLLEKAGFSIDQIQPSVGSAETAGLIVCLSLAGMSFQALHSRSPSLILVPLLALSIPITNAIFWLLAKMMPSWSAVPAGYQVIARK